MTAVDRMMMMTFTMMRGMKEAKTAKDLVFAKQKKGPGDGSRSRSSRTSESSVNTRIISTTCKINGMIQITSCETTSIIRLGLMGRYNLFFHASDCL